MTKPKNAPKAAGTTKGSKISKQTPARPILTGNDALAVLKADSPRKALAALATPTEPTPPKAPKLAKAAPEEGLVVFAFRLTREERDVIHAATGPSKASKFVRTLAVAGARLDEPAIKEILAGLKPSAAA